MSNVLKSIKSGCIVVDVRSPGEYQEGHLAGSINIPLSEVTGRLDELKDKAEVIVCCASGIRSNKAMNVLAQNGIVAKDGGSWLNLKSLVIKNQQ